MNDTLPPLPRINHPEPHTYRFTDLERAYIEGYAMNYASKALAAVEAERDAMRLDYSRLLEKHNNLHTNAARDRAERDALQRKVQEMALQALADDTQHREVEAERDALLAAIPEGCTPADAKTLREANHLLAAERDALRADAERYRWLAGRCRRTPEHWGGRWSIVIDGPCPKDGPGRETVDAAIDAAMKGTK